MVATNFSVSSRQGFKLWGLSPSGPSLAWPLPEPHNITQSFSLYNLKTWFKEYYFFHFFKIFHRQTNSWNAITILLPNFASLLEVQHSIGSVFQSAAFLSPVRRGTRTSGDMEIKHFKQKMLSKRQKQTNNSKRSSGGKLTLTDDKTCVCLLQCLFLTIFPVHFMG